MGKTLLIIWLAGTLLLAGLGFWRRRKRRQRAQFACSFLLLAVMFYMLIGVMAVVSRRIESLTDDSDPHPLDVDDLRDALLWPYRLL